MTKKKSRNNFRVRVTHHDARSHVICDSLTLLQSNAQPSSHRAYGKSLASKAQRQGDSIKNLLKPSLPNQSSVYFSGSLGFKNLGRITTGSTVDKQRTHKMFIFSVKLL